MYQRYSRNVCVCVRECVPSDCFGGKGFDKYQGYRDILMYSSDLQYLIMTMSGYTTSSLLIDHNRENYDLHAGVLFPFILRPRAISCTFYCLTVFRNDDMVKLGQIPSNSSNTRPRKSPKLTKCFGLLVYVLRFLEALDGFPVDGVLFEVLTFLWAAPKKASSLRCNHIRIVHLFT